MVFFVGLARSWPVDTLTKLLQGSTGGIGSTTPSLAIAAQGKRMRRPHLAD